MTEDSNDTKTNKREPRGAPKLIPVPGVGFRTRIRYGKHGRDRFLIKILDYTAALKRDRELRELRGYAPTPRAPGQELAPARCQSGWPRAQPGRICRGNRPHAPAPRLGAIAGRQERHANPLPARGCEATWVQGHSPCLSVVLRVPSPGRRSTHRNGNSGSAKLT